MRLVGRFFPGWLISKFLPAVGGLRGYIGGNTIDRLMLYPYTESRKAVFPVVLLSAFLVLMLKWTLNLSAFVLALPMLYIFGCGLYTLYCQEWMQFLILLVAEFGCFVLIFMGALIADAAERFSGWVAGL